MSYSNKFTGILTVRGFIMNDSFVKRFDSIFLYVVIYAAAFITFYLIIPYILPFVLGTLIALVLQPVINYSEKKFKFKRSIAGLISVLIIFAAVTAIIVLIIVNIIGELISLSAFLPGIVSDFVEKGNTFLDIAAAYYNTIDPRIIESAKGITNQIFSGSFTIAFLIINFIINVIKSLPQFLMVILFTFLTAIYVSIDLPKIKSKIMSYFNKEDSSKVRNIVSHANSMLGNYIKAYLILISVTFVITYIGMSILGLEYALLLSIITGIADLLPILGPGTILIPLGIGNIIGANYTKGIGLIILYILAVIIRQVIEPKIVSSSLGIYPLAIIIAIFIGLKAYGFIGMIFTVFLVVFYTVLRKVGVM